MTHINPANFASVTGRVARDAEVRKNSDGSHKVLFTVMVDRNYRDKNGEVPSDAVPFEIFVRKDTEIAKSPYVLFVHKGDLVTVTYESRSDEYEQNGEKVYKNYNEPTGIKPLEPKSVTQARLGKRVSEAQATNDAARAAQAQTVPAGAAQDELPFGN